MLGKLSKGIVPREEKRQAESFDRQEQTRIADLAITVNQTMSAYLTVNDEDLSEPSTTIEKNFDSI